MRLNIYLRIMRRRAMRRKQWYERILAHRRAQAQGMNPDSQASRAFDRMTNEYHKRLSATQEEIKYLTQRIRSR